MLTEQTQLVNATDVISLSNSIDDAHPPNGKVAINNPAKSMRLHRISQQITGGIIDIYIGDGVVITEVLTAAIVCNLLAFLQ